MTLIEKSGINALKPAKTGFSFKKGGSISIIERAEEIRTREEATRKTHELKPFLEEVGLRLERLGQLIENSGIRQYLEEARDDLRKSGKTADVVLINPPFSVNVPPEEWPALVLIWGEGYKLADLERKENLEERLALLAATYTLPPDKEYPSQFDTIEFTPVSSDYEGPKAEHFSIGAFFDTETGVVFISGAEQVGVIFEKNFSDRKATVEALAKAYLSPKVTSCAK